MRDEYEINIFDYPLQINPQYMALDFNQVKPTLESTRQWKSAFKKAVALVSLEASSKHNVHTEYSQKFYNGKVTKEFDAQADTDRSTSTSKNASHQTQSSNSGIDAASSTTNLGAGFGGAGEDINRPSFSEKIPGVNISIAQSNLYKSHQLLKTIEEMYFSDLEFKESVDQIIKQQKSLNFIIEELDPNILGKSEGNIVRISTGAVTNKEVIAQVANTNEK
jgi:hypothetical protein